MKEHSFAKWLMLIAGIFLMLFSIVVETGTSNAKAADARPAVDVPIIMYHSILKDPTLTGTYVLPPDQLESDLKYIKSCGYTTILMKDLVNYVEDPAAVLPKKPIIITFDDGNYNNYVYAYPLMKQYDMKCIMSVVGEYVDKADEKQSPVYSYLNWNEIKEMSDFGYVEIGNHSYDMHTMDWRRTGIRKNNGETEEQYYEALQNDVGKLQELIKEKTGITPLTFAYPFGKACDCSEELLPMFGFKATLCCYEEMNHIKKGDSLCLLKRFNRAAGTTSAQFFKNILVSD